MNLEVVFAVAFSIVFLIALIYTINILNLKRRFAKHRIVRDFVDRWSDAIIQKIAQAAVTENERFFVVAEHTKISDDSILCESCSVFFDRERMCHLQTKRSRRLMAYAIAEQIKKRTTEKCSSIERLASKNYHVRTKCQKVLNASQRSYLVYIHYIEPNDSYVPAEKW